MWLIKYLCGWQLLACYASVFISRMGIKAPEETEINLSDHQMPAEYTHFTEYFWFSESQQVRESFLQQLHPIESSRNSRRKRRLPLYWICITTCNVLAKNFLSGAIFSSFFNVFSPTCWLNLSNHCKWSLC